MKCWALIRKLQTQRSKKLTRSWPSSGILTRTPIIKMRPSKDFEKYLRPMKTYPIPKNAKYTTHMASRGPGQAPSTISIPTTQKIFSRNSLTIMSSTMTPFSAVSLEIKKATGAREEVSLATWDLLGLVGVCLTMMIFSTELEDSAVAFPAAVSVAGASGVDYLNQWAQPLRQCTFFSI